MKIFKYVFLLGIVALLFSCSADNDVLTETEAADASIELSETPIETADGLDQENSRHSNINNWKFPLYRYNNGVDHFYTTDFNELGNGGSGYTYEGIAARVFLAPGTGRVPLYRYNNPTIQNHYYTIDFNEYGNGSNGYTYEGIECYVHATTASDPNRKAFVKLYHPTLQNHFYTISAAEAHIAGNNGYQLQSVACFVYAP